MAYNSGFPLNYQYMMPQAPQMPYGNSGGGMATPQAQQVGNIIWVSGEAGAKAYLVAPNTTVQLWDSEADVIYVKSADASGMPSIKVLDYTVRNNQPHNVPAVQEVADYVTREEFNSFVEKFNQFTENKKPVKGGKADE